MEKKTKKKTSSLNLVGCRPSKKVLSAIDGPPEMS